MMKRIALYFTAVLVFWVQSGYSAQVVSIDFKVENGQSIIEILSDEPLNYTPSESPQDKQVILDLAGATLSTGASRKLDTSSFQSPVTLVSPYALQEEGDQSRVVVQLREFSSPQITQSGSMIRIAFGQSSPQVVNEIQPIQEPSTSVATDLVDIPDVAPGDLTSTDDAVVSDTPGLQVADEGKVENFLASKETQKFTGTPVTIKLKDADVRDVLRLIGEASGFNIIVGKGVKGTITLSLTDVPWDQALDVVLKTLNLGAERNRNILRVMTLANLTDEKQQELQAKLAAEASSPRITRVFKISYADPTSLQTILSTFGSSRSGGGAQATVQVDTRTNSIIVQDIEDNIQRIEKIIGILDTQTAQVFIEAKIVEASEGFDESMQGNLGFGGTESSAGNQFFSSFSGANPVDNLIGSPGVFSDGSAAATSANNGGSFGLSPSLGILPGIEKLNAFLQFTESESLTKTISAPKTVVLDKESATILQSTPVAISSSINENGTVTTRKDILQATISLNVTPTVTNDENVLMNLDISRDVPEAVGGSDTAVAQRNIKTRVLVRSGSTLVIGGIYTMQNTESSFGFPILRKIPVLGLLFGGEISSTSRSELFMFITPRILNVKKAGISG